MRFVKALAMGTTAGLLTACGALLSLEPLTFDDEAARADGGPEAEGKSDALEAEVLATPDAAADASTPTFCSSQTSDFCDDFEGARTIQGQWSTFELVGSVKAALEAGTYVTEMATADAAAMEVPRGGLSLQRAWTPGDGGVRRRADARFRASVDLCPAVGSEVTPITFYLPECQIQLVVNRQASDCVVLMREICEPGPVYRVSSTLLVPVGKWEDYELELAETLASAGGSATLHVGAQTVPFPLTPVTQPSQLTVLLGLFQGSYYGADARARFDDVRIDYAK